MRLKQPSHEKQSGPRLKKNGQPAKNGKPLGWQGTARQQRSRAKAKRKITAKVSQAMQGLAATLPVGAVVTPHSDFLFLTCVTRKQKPN